MQPSKLLDWAGQTCVVLASGPSLTDEQLAAVADAHVRVITVNSTVFKYPVDPDVVYAGDFMWWKVNGRDAKMRTFGGADRWTCDRTAAERYGLNWVKGVNALGLGRGPHIHTNGNSLAQAINLAYLFGCRRILLLGADMKLGPNGERHWHPDHPSPLMQGQDFSGWLFKFNHLAVDLKKESCEVVNCSPGSAMTCFPMSTIEKELG
jgi:hypothetical protein